MINGLPVSAWRIKEAARLRIVDPKVIPRLHIDPVNARVIKYVVLMATRSELRIQVQRNRRRADSLQLHATLEMAMARSSLTTSEGSETPAMNDDVFVISDAGWREAKPAPAL